MVFENWMYLVEGAAEHSHTHSYCSRGHVHYGWHCGWLMEKEKDGS